MNDHTVFDFDAYVQMQKDRYGWEFVSATCLITFEVPPCDACGISGRTARETVSLEPKQKATGQDA